MTDALPAPSPAPPSGGVVDAREPLGRRGLVPTLTSLTLYPLKSCAGLPVTRATVEPLGLEHDRRWMAVRPDGSFMT